MPVVCNKFFRVALKYTNQAMPERGNFVFYPPFAKGEGKTKTASASGSPLYKRGVRGDFSGRQKQHQIPLNPPFVKGEEKSHGFGFFPPFAKGGRGDLPYCRRTRSGIFPPELFTGASMTSKEKSISTWLLSNPFSKSSWARDASSPRVKRMVALPGASWAT